MDLLVEVGSEHSAWFPAGSSSLGRSCWGRGADVVIIGALELETREAILAEAIPL
jgi:hypothetical protein